jgi:hypothetical protein
VLGLFLYYLYHQFAPPYAIYDDFSKSETLDSLALAGLKANKYVFFRQLQGAGFNNQASRQPQSTNLVS